MNSAGPDDHNFEVVFYENDGDSQRNPQIKVSTKSSKPAQVYVTYHYLCRDGEISSVDTLSIIRVSALRKE